MTLRLLAILVLLGLAPLAPVAHAEQAAPAPVVAGEVQPSVTQHRMAIDGETLEFSGRVEMFALADETGTAEAHLFTVSYIADDAGADRPVTFLMNGGPGAASAYLHVGGVGPWVIDTDSMGRPTGDDALVVNPDTWLAFTDLVFIDPVGTGFSRPTDPDDRSFYDRDADLDSLARLIELWLDTHDRLTAPVYLAGESYGGYRAAALPRRMMHDRGIRLAGTVLVSPVIDFSHLRHHSTRPLSWAFVLPSYAATAAGHGLSDGADPEALRAFALEDYVLALIHPRRMPALLPRLAEITGLDEDLLRERRGRVAPGEFRRRVLAGENKIVSAYDGLVATADPDRSERAPRVDPVLEGTAPAFVTGLLSHLRERLDWPHGRNYRLLNRRVNRAWTYGTGRSQGYASAMRELHEVMALDEGFRVFAVHGETDLVTPWLATEWLLEQLDDALGGAGDRLAFATYPGGHMFYMRPDASAAWRDDMARFFAGG